MAGFIACVFDWLRPVSCVPLFFPFPWLLLRYFGVGRVSSRLAGSGSFGADVASASRAGVVGVVGGTFAAGVVPLSCAAGISDKFLLPVEFLFII